jgi:E3 ubiquitin-protein ligase SHPRH
MEERECLICVTPFENGLLTVCGHLFCEECMSSGYEHIRTVQRANVE